VRGKAYKFFESDANQNSPGADEEILDIEELL
jgi:hypothetical protein